MPYQARHLSMLITHEPTCKKEVDGSIKIGVSKKINGSQWAAPTFIIPKINGTVIYISDFRFLNIQYLLRK